MFILGALHDIEASFLADASLRELRTGSSRQPLANVGAVLSLLDGPPGCDPAFCVVWFRLRGYLAYWPGEVPGVYRYLDSAAEGCPGRHGPAHLLVESAAEIGFQWDSRQLGWERIGLLVLSNLTGPVQHFRAAVLETWRGKVAADLRVRNCFRGGSWLDFHGTLQLLNSDHVREIDKALLRGVPCLWSLEWISAVKGSACASSVLRWC